MECDSHRMKPSSSSVGTRPFGFILRYSVVFTTPYCMPALRRSNSRPSSSRHQSVFFTLTEFFRPQIFSISFLLLESRGLAIAARIARREPAAVHLPDHLPAAELVVV